MARCEICDKDTTFSKTVSHSHRRTNRDGTVKKINVCTRCLKSGKVERAI